MLHAKHVAAGTARQLEDISRSATLTIRRRTLDADHETMAVVDRPAGKPRGRSPFRQNTKLLRKFVRKRGT